MACCCSRSPEDDVDVLPGAQALTMSFPMWVLPIRVFLSMSGPPPCHQVLQQQGQLVQWQPGMYCIFCSHEWLGFGAADPDGTQLAVLRAALQNIVNGRLKVQTDIAFLIVYQQVLSLSRVEVGKLAEGFLWFDWFAIPQITARCQSVSPTIGSSVQDAIDSIPSYVEAVDMFIALCPSSQHSGRSGLCDYSTWRSRGWCRVELLAAVLSQRQMRMLVVRSATNAFIMFPNDIFSARPGMGEFAVDSDKEVIFPVLKQILDSHTQNMWERAESAKCRDRTASARCRDRARLFTALRSRFLANLGTPEEKRETEAASLACADTVRFLHELRFGSLTESNITGLGPMYFAAVVGNIPMIRLLAEAKAKINEPCSAQGEQPEVMLWQGANPLHGAVFFNGDPGVVRCLLELRGDSKGTDKGGFHIIHGACASANVRCIELCLEIRVDLETRQAQGVHPLHVATVAGHAESVAALLQHRATPDPCFGLGTTPLMIAADNSEVAIGHLLLQHRADVNLVARPCGAMGFVMSSALRCASGWLSSHGPLRQLAMEEGSTPLHRAAMAGHLEMVRELLVANADLAQRHRLGWTAQQLAERAGHVDVASELAASAVGQNFFTI